MSSKYSKSGSAGRGLAIRGMKETGPPPLGRGMGVAQPRMQSLGVGAVGMRRAGSKDHGMAKVRLEGRDCGGGGRRLSAHSQDEKFQLLRFEEGADRPFAMAIRLTPELLCGLKRAEAEGSACSMKFGVTPVGHVLKIGDVELKFNSAREHGGLCDIFEEQRRGEDGNGVLKEAGSVWRKLSVLRTLNASEKDRVKKRSVEAQQQQKSRKAIILDPTHSQNLTQSSSIVGDAMGRRPPNKTNAQPPLRKFKPLSPARSPVAAPACLPSPKAVVSTASATASAKVAKRASEFPSPGRMRSLPPPYEKPGGEESAVRIMSSVQQDSTPSPGTTPGTANTAKPWAVVGSTDLRSCLITLLSDNPKGMTLKALEKSLGDAMPLVKPEKKTIEKAIRAIASYHAPGKYVLKEGVSFAKPSPNSGSSPENAAAESPPLVDSPAPPDMNDGSSHDRTTGVACRIECGLVLDKPISLHSSASEKAPCIVQKSNDNAVSRAIRKANESYLKSQPQSQQAQSKLPPTAYAQIFEVDTAEEDSEVETEQISAGVDETGEVEIVDGQSSPGAADVENLKREHESVLNFPKKAKNRGSESSSSSSSSDGESDSSDSGDSCSKTSGSGSDSDSDGSSSDSDDGNMDEDVEIVSDDEREAPHQKPKVHEKKKIATLTNISAQANHLPSTHQITGMTLAPHQSKDARRAKLKPPEEYLSQELEELDIGGPEGAGHVVVDLEERAAVRVGTLDAQDSEVDVVSVGGRDSPEITASVSPVDIGTEESKREVADAPVDPGDNRDSLVESPARANNSNLSKEERANSGAEAEKASSLESLTDLGTLKAGALEGRIISTAKIRRIVMNNSPQSKSAIAAKDLTVHTDNRPPARDSFGQCSSPSRPEIGVKSLPGSLTLKKDATERSSSLMKEIGAKRTVNLEVRKSCLMDAKTEWEELVDKLVEAPVRSRPRPGKSTEFIRVAKHVDASLPVPSIRTPEPSAKDSRDLKGCGPSGRETEAEVLSNTSRPLRDGSWRHNSDEPGLLEKPENLGRTHGRESETNVPTSRQLKVIRGSSNEPTAARRNQSMNDPDSWGKSARDLDGKRLGNEIDVLVDRISDGRKDLYRSECLQGPLPDSSYVHNETTGRESSDRESGEWRESTPGLKQTDGKESDSLQIEMVQSRDLEAKPVGGICAKRTQNRDLRMSSPGKVDGDLSKRFSPTQAVLDFRKPSPVSIAVESRQPSPVKPGGDLRKPSPAKGAGDIRNTSPSTSKVQKPAYSALKEPQKFDQIAARDANRAVCGSGKLSSSRPVAEKPEGGSSLIIKASNETFERSMELRGIKRQLEDGSSEPPRMFKKSSIAPGGPSPHSRGVSDLSAVRPAERKHVSPDFVRKPQCSEPGKGVPKEVSTNLADPITNASFGDNGSKQRPLRKTQKPQAKDVPNPPRVCDLKAEIGAVMHRPSDGRKSENRQPDHGRSACKGLKSSSSPEKAFGKSYFVKYEKDAADLRGPIKSTEEAEEYKKEYQSKYLVYARLYTDLEKNGGHFHSFKRELLQAISHPEKLQQIRTKVRMEFHTLRKEFKRMQKTFDILHEELQTIKERLRYFARNARQG